jgi:hypothetical protein
MSVESGNGFDGWLEQQLHNEAAGSGGPSPSPSQAAYHAAYLQGGLHMSFLAQAASVVSTKGAAGLAGALLAVGAAGVGAEAAASGSANPSDWGATVVQQVDACKKALNGAHGGIGQCVSAVAKTHGAQVRAEHSTEAPLHASGPRVNHPAGGQPTNKPGGKPTSVPTKH